MASNLRAKFNEWIVIFVLLPAALAMVICVFFFWRLLQQNHARLLDDQITIISSALEQTLHSESLRLKTMVNLPATESLITLARRRAATASQEQEFKTETTWAEAARDDMMVRSVLDNEIALLFRQTCDQIKHIASLTIADGSGALLATTQKTPTFYQNQNDWWALLRLAGGDQVFSEAATATGLLGLVLPRRAESGAIIAVVREELSLPQLIADMSGGGSRSNANQVAVFLVAQDARLISGPADEATMRAGTGMAEQINASGKTRGRRAGYRFNGRSLDAGIYWARPLWIVAAHRENRFPLSLYGPLALAVVIGGAAVFGVFVLARGVGRRLFFEPMREAAEAGVWLLRRAGGRAGALAADGKPGSPALGANVRSALAAAHPWANIPYEENTPLHKELSLWFAHAQQNAKGDVAQISVAMKHDLALAIEFQQAFMNRRAPEIPEVYTEGRLRLEFSHIYRPALALGGDFCDIEAVGSDCAGIFIGDVMGHGTRSALLASTIRTLLNENYKIGRNPAHFLKELNKSLCEILRVLPDQFFASACYFTADTTARVATYAIAGHPAPFHLHRSVGRVVRLEKPKPRGAALGVLPEEEFGADSVRLADGDLFVLYTDGAYETSNRAGEQYGMGRLEKALQDHIYDTPDDLLKNVLDDILKFAGSEPLADDICFVSVLVTSKPPAKA